MIEKDKKVQANSEDVQAENPPFQEEQEEIPQDMWDQFDDAMDKILKVPKKDQEAPNQQAG